MIRSLFAASDGPHIAVAPEHLFEVGGVTITNSMVYGWLSATIIIVTLLILKNKVRIDGASGIAKMLDAGTEFIINLLATALNSRKKAIQYAPFFVTTFFFIFMSNWLGLLPGVGLAINNGESPLFRPFTADFNGTLAMAVVMIVIVQVLAIRESSLLKHLGHYFQGSFKNPMTIILGIIELFSELTRMLSLALRLFLNVVIGEILISVFSYLGGTVAPVAALPFTLMEIFVGILQAYIFVMLCASYLGVATAHNHEHDHDDDNQELKDSVGVARA
jgi:F-type H+-transporting ATPase subunit a